MALIVLTYPTFPAGVAYRQHVTDNFEDVLAVVNGSIEDDNILNASITASSKLKVASIVAALIANENIRTNHIDWTQANGGVQAWRQEGYSGANGSRLIRIEKTITLAAVTTEQSFAINWATGDNPDGSTTFLTAPTITEPSILDASGLITGTDTIQYKKFTARTTTGCTFKIRFTDAPTAGDVVIMALAAGAA